MRSITRILLSFAVVLAWATACTAADEIDFRSQVAPIFERACVRCHSGEEPKGGLSLATAEAALAGGDSGPSIAPGEPESSFLLDYIAGEKPEMPKEDDPLSADEVEVVRRWIAGGAGWPREVVLQDKHVAKRSWAFEPLERPAVPQIASDWIRTPIDAFVLARLEAEGLTPAPEADRRALIRRLTFDLIGLPPTPAEVELFVNDPSPRAYEELVDRLLASPHYGERWARHWLDVARYGDSHGYDKDKPRPNAWPYRDYVIRAFNEDRPYSRFVREQLAGDHFYPGTVDGITALGFIAAGPFDHVGHYELREGTLDKAITRNLDRDDMVAATMNAFTSLTAQCARCHDHKFDPISQTDYYRLQAVFAAVDRADRPYGEDPSTAATRTALRDERKMLTKLKTEIERLAKSRPDNADLNRLLADIDAALEFSTAALNALPEEKLVYAAATQFEGEMLFQPTGGKPRPIHVLNRGNESQPLEEVGPGAVGCFEDLPALFDVPADADESLRRAALAEWIVDRRNPLTWRSIVNRVWQYHFDQAIVDTPNDFGRMGAAPTHPELLDWLAVEFRDGGQSIKALHRLIVTSSTYRQSSESRADYAKIDASNRLLWRMNRRRLDAESIRDAVLAVSGCLDTRMYGPAFQNFGFKDDHSPQYKYFEHDPNDPNAHRRSIYRFIVRSAPDPFMDSLDCADSSLSVAKRNETLTALQALAMLNDKFMIAMAERFADRVDGAADDMEGKIAKAYRLALGRAPTSDESAVLADIAGRHGMASACRVIFNMNEFIFID